MFGRKWVNLFKMSFTGLRAPVTRVVASQDAAARYFSDSTKDPSSKEKFDEFRAREESKEQHFEQQYAAERLQQQKGQEEAGQATDAKVSNVQNKILEAALPHVGALGWSKQALAQGAESLGYPGIAHGMFPRGGAELIDFYNAQCNRHLIEYMEGVVKEQEGKQEKEAPTKFVFKAIQHRLRMLEPYKSQWPQALAVLTMPPNVPIALSNLLTMVDDICYYAGDRSVDFNWYTRRIGLASIYKATELFMLQDKSPDHKDTWAFLEHRIADASKLQDLLSQSGGLSNNIQEAGKSIFDTARNILGLNFNRR